MHSLHKVFMSVPLVLIAFLIVLGSAGGCLALEPVLADAEVAVELGSLPELGAELVQSIDRQLESQIVALTTQHLDTETEAVVEHHVGATVPAPALAANTSLGFSSTNP